MTRIVYFIIISITTIGYGDTVPASDSSRLFSIFYTSIGLIYVATWVNSAIEALFEKMSHQQHLRILSGAIPADDTDLDRILSRKYFFYRSMMVLVMLIGGLLMSYYEGWTIVEGIWWAYQTTTTIGKHNNR